MTNTTEIPTSSALRRGDPRELFARAAAVTTTTIAAVRADQLDGPTPCSDLDVRALLAHLVGVVDRAAAISRGEDAMAVSGVHTAADEGWAAAWADAVAAAAEAWRDDAALERPVSLPWATGPGGEILKGYVNELVVHTWDLAEATAQTRAWDDDVVAAAYESITAALPAEGRTAMFEAIMAKMDTAAAPKGFGGAPFAEKVPVPDDAAPIDRLVAYTGRTPRR